MQKTLQVLLLGSVIFTATNAHSSHGPGATPDHELLQLMQSTQVPELPAYAICSMRSYSSSYNVSGFVRFYQDQAVGTVISGNITGLTSNGTHAFHIHAQGDLTDGCTSLLAHYNPFNETHGGPGSCHRHIGDLGNLEADETGTAIFNFTDYKISLIGPYSILGRSCVVHLYEDDLGEGGTVDSLTTGSAGARIGCAVVGRATAH